MAQQFALDGDTPDFNPRYADVFVVFAATVMALAIGVWCLTRLGLPLWSGAVAALAVYALLLSVHLTVRRSLLPADAAAAEAERDEVWMSGPLARAQMPPPEVGPPAPAQAPAPAPVSPAEEVSRWAAAARKIETGSKDAPAEDALARAADPFNFRPKPEPSLPQPLAEPSFADALADAASLPPARTGAERPDTTLEYMEQQIKKLADAINTKGTVAKPAPASATEALIGQSVAALQAAHRSAATHPQTDLRTTPGPSGDLGGGGASWWPMAESARRPEPEPKSPPPPPAGPPALNPQLARIAEAVAAERIEVMLEPIHALAEGRAKHFEVSTRLQTADGATLEQGELARAARGSGLMPHIDSARMVRAARVARRLSERGRQGSVLAAVAGESLADDDFLFSVVEEGGGGTMNLVLAFTQAEVRAFTPGHTQALGALSTAGFRFALEEVTDLDMDFAALQEMGFAFVELDAPVFLDGLPAAAGRVPASDICRHLAEFGMSLIVGRIEDDWLLARVLGFGVLLGKGSLFGAPRLVKEEVVAG